MVVMIVGCITCYGQIAKNDYKDMIDSAILMQKSAYRLNVYLIDEKDYPYQLTAKSLHGKFKYLSIFDKSNRPRLKKGINAWKIIPTLHGNQLTIDIIDFTITWRKNRYNFGNGGGATVLFEYSCIDQKWILKQSNWNGL